MNDLKLIAIRPLKNCNENFLHPLEEGRIYCLTSEYDFSDYSDDNRTVKYTNSQLSDLYILDESDRAKLPTIRISAILGENGSGKSKLMTLFYATCYNISAIKGILFDEVRQIHLNESNCIKNLNVEIFYRINENTFLLRMEDGKISFFKLSDQQFVFTPQEFRINDYFYTIAIDYSLHALNSEVVGTWIDKVFHKNDGYQTPIVLNPFRKKGNIDINHEEYLVENLIKLTPSCRSNVTPLCRPKLTPSADPN